MELDVIQQKIFEIRRRRIILDFHLAELYGVETRVFKRIFWLASDGSILYIKGLRVKWDSDVWLNHNIQQFQDILLLVIRRGDDV
jgi:hypothetical protein